MVIIESCLTKIILPSCGSSLGVGAIFGPGTKLPIAALEVVNLISGHVEKQRLAEG